MKINKYDINPEHLQKSSYCLFKKARSLGVAVGNCTFIPAVIFFVIGAIYDWQTIFSFEVFYVIFYFVILGVLSGTLSGLFYIFIMWIYLVCKFKFRYKKSN